MSTTRRKPIRLIEQPFPRADRKALATWLVKNDRLTQGPLVGKFERSWAKWLGREYAVFCNSGSSANLLAYAALNATDRLPAQVVVPAVAWPTTVAPLLQLGRKVTFVDASPNTWGVLGSVESNVLVDVLGVPAARQAKALLVDDCGAHGSRFQGRKVGSSGDGLLSTFSFFAGHAMTTIEGGMVCTDDRDLYEMLLMLRAHGWTADFPLTAEMQDRAENRFATTLEDPFRQKFTFYVAGFNLRGTDLQAFLGLRQLRRLDVAVEARIRNGDLYRTLLEREGFEFQAPLDGDEPAPIGVGVLADSVGVRMRIAAALRSDNIEVRPVGGGNMDRQPFARGVLSTGCKPTADSIHERGFQLPCHPRLTKRDIRRVVDVCAKARAA